MREAVIAYIWSNVQDYIMSNAIDFTAACCKNSCTGKAEIATDVAKNNRVRCLERADSPEVGLLGSHRFLYRQNHSVNFVNVCTRGGLCPPLRPPLFLLAKPA